MAESKASSKTYVLKKGASHHSIVDGEMVKKTGDGTKNQSFALTDDQYAAFQDKFEGEAVADQDPTTIAAGIETGARPTIVEGAAARSAAENPGTGTENDGGEGDTKDASTPLTDAEKAAAAAQKPAAAAGTAKA